MWDIVSSGPGYGLTSVLKYVVAKMPSSSCFPHHTCQSVHVVLIVSVIYFPCFVVCLSVLPQSSTQHFTLAFTAFRFASISNVDLQLCCPGRPLSSATFRYFNNDTQLTLQFMWHTVANLHEIIGASANESL